MTPVDVQSERYEFADYSVPALSASASVDGDGKLHITLSNANPHKDIPVSVFLRGMQASRVQGRVLQADAMGAHNTFAQPNAVKPQAFTGAKPAKGDLELSLPKMSVVVLEAA